VDIKREAGVKVGLLKVRLMRPFPKERMRRVLAGKKAFAVVDRNVCFGWNTGALYMETKAAVCDLEERLGSLPVIGGLGGADISLAQLQDTIDALWAGRDDRRERECLWLMR